jgi:RHS repeat-associated protein
MGNPTQITDGAGDTWGISGSVATPSAITPGGNSNLATTISYATSWAVTSVTGPNAANATTAYDQYGRPSQSTIPDGATTTYTYTYNPNVQIATLGSQWKKTTLDGFGRTLSVLTGHDSTTVAEVDTQYAPSGCSPLGKVSQVSLPYTPGQQNPVWTVTTYDTSGRTLTVTKPDGASKTTYSYQGNTTTVTDPAGKWKTFTTDAFGNLTTVTEPDPNNPARATYVTTYTYNAVSQLIQVSMPRNGITQTRSFTWSGSDLASATNPENGTVTYQYDGAHHVTQRTDAKNQQTQYSYDVYGRLTEVRHGTLSSGSFSEILNQRVDYYYDSYPTIQAPQAAACVPSSAGWPYNLAGRLAAVVFADENTGASYNYGYVYNQAGRVTGQCLTTSTPRVGYLNGGYAALNVGYTWDNQGRMTSLSYPGQYNQWNSTEPGPVNSYTYDAVGNLTSLSQQCSDCSYPYSPTSANATYNQAGQLTSLNYGGYQETRGYNSLLQLTTATALYGYTSAMNMQYNYSATQNNGRILSSVDAVAGQTVSYTYDALNRLISAATKPTDTGAWGQTYSYDGFGNLLAQVPTQGSAPQAYPAVDSTTNHVGSVDANGNPAGWNYTWDVENRLLSYTCTTCNTSTTYTYDPWGKRLVVNAPTQSSGGGAMVNLYGIDGKLLAAYGQSCPGFVYTLSVPSSNFAIPPYFTYFGGKLLEPTDRLGSMRFQSGPYLTSMPAAYFPWGQEQTSTQDGTIKFAGYWRDATGGSQDYADQRYYNATYGRFWTVDPAGAAAVDPANPTSWNQYAYTLDDPVNNSDPTGMEPGDQPSTNYPCIGPADTVWLASMCASFGQTVGGLQFFSLFNMILADTRPDNAYKNPSPAGLAKAKSALNNLASADLSATNCQKDLTKAGVTANQVQSEASQISQANDLFDGVSSNTAVTTDKFTGDILGYATVGQYFLANDSTGDLTTALSQAYGGLAIWVNTSAMAPVSIGTVEATLLHEILHKISPSGTSDAALGMAILGFDPGSNSSLISAQLYVDCFGGK